jgi:protein TonB
MSTVTVEEFDHTTAETQFKSRIELSLPWEVTQAQNHQFKLILKRVLMILLLLGIAIPWLPIFDAEEELREPVVTTKIQLKPQFIKPIPNRTVAKTTPEKKQIQKKPTPVSSKKEAAPNKVAQKTAAKPQKANVKHKATDVGVAAFTNQLSALRSSLDIKKFQNKNVAKSGGHTQQARRSTLSENQINKTSGGIKTKNLRSLGSNTQLATHTAAEVSGPILADNYQAGGREFGAGMSTGRDMESIRRIFEKHKGAINNIYVSALRNNPRLQGKFLFQILIEPDGSISDIEMISSELDHPHLENRLLQRFSSINFGREEVDPTPVRYIWNFLPS